jgi:hypothetical protein
MWPSLVDFDLNLTRFSAEEIPRLVDLNLASAS